MKWEVDELTAGHFMKRVNGFRSGGNEGAPSKGMAMTVKLVEEEKGGRQERAFESPHFLGTKIFVDKEVLSPGDGNAPWAKAGVEGD